MQIQNLRGRHPLKSYHNGMIIAKDNVNSYSVKIHGARAGAGPRVQPDADSAEAVLCAGAEMANPGILGVLRSMPRLKAGADSVLGAGQSRGGADPGSSRVLGPEGSPAAAATGTSGLGGSRQLLDSRDRETLKEYIGIK